MFVYLKCNISKTINKYPVCPTVPHLLVIFRILVCLVRRGRDKFPNQNIMISYTHSKKFIHKRAIRIFLHILTFQITILYSVYTQNFQSSWKSFLLGCNGHGLVELLQRGPHQLPHLAAAGGPAEGSGEVTVVEVGDVGECLDSNGTVLQF